MAKKKFEVAEFHREEYQSAYQAAKALLSLQDEGATITVGDIVDSLREIVFEFENILPRESQNYDEGQIKQLALIKTHTTFSFVAPKGIKHQDKVDWAQKTLKDLCLRVKDLTGGDVLIEPIVPPAYR